MIQTFWNSKALWKNRQQVWQRLEENGQISMKVAPSQIEFTLPSPKLGIESLPVIDPPWVPKFKTKINTIHDRGQVSISPCYIFKRFKSNSLHRIRDYHESYHKKYILQCPYCKWLWQYYRINKRYHVDIRMITKNLKTRLWFYLMQLQESNLFNLKSQKKVNKTII